MGTPPGTIGTVAKQARVNVETIRYYQRIGLLGEPRRPPGGVRRYPPETVARLRFIKRAQDLGFALDEIAALLRLNDGVRCRDARGLAAAKLALLEARMRDMSRMRRSLRRLIEECDAGGAPTRCPIIDALSSSGSTRTAAGSAAAARSDGFRLRQRVSRTTRCATKAA